MRYRQIIVPTREKHSVELPEYLYGKKVEVVASEIEVTNGSVTPLPKDLKDKDFWNDIEFTPDFPSVETIRTTAWPPRE